MTTINWCPMGGTHQWHETPGSNEGTAQCIKCGERYNGKK